jgi:hypothetical protein
MTVSLPLSAYRLNRAVTDLTEDNLGTGRIIDLYTHYHDDPTGTSLATVQWGEGDAAMVADRQAYEMEPA